MRKKFSYISVRNPISGFYTKAKVHKTFKEQGFWRSCIENMFQVKIGIPVFSVIFNFSPVFSFADQDEKRFFLDVVNNIALKNIRIHLKFCLYESLFFLWNFVYIVVFDVEGSLGNAKLATRDRLESQKILSLPDHDVDEWDQIRKFPSVKIKMPSTVLDAFEGLEI